MENEVLASYAIFKIIAERSFHVQSCLGPLDTCAMLSEPLGHDVSQPAAAPTYSRSSLPSYVSEEVEFEPHGEETAMLGGPNSPDRHIGWASSGKEEHEDPA